MLAMTKPVETRAWQKAPIRRPIGWSACESQRTGKPVEISAKLTIKPTTGQKLRRTTLKLW